MDNVLLLQEKTCVSKVDTFKTGMFIETLMISQPLV